MIDARGRRICAAALLVIALAFPMVLSNPTLRAQGRGARTPRAMAPFDPTGYWVAIISEDWRWRVITPARGGIVSIPLNGEGQRGAATRDPAEDEAAGEPGPAHGA